MCTSRCYVLWIFKDTTLRDDQDRIMLINGYPGSGIKMF